MLANTDQYWQQRLHLYIQSNSLLYDVKRVEGELFWNLYYAFLQQMFITILDICPKSIIPFYKQTYTYPRPQTLAFTDKQSSTHYTKHCLNYCHHMIVWFALCGTLIGRCYNPFCMRPSHSRNIIILWIWDVPS